MKYKSHYYAFFILLIIFAGCNESSIHISSPNKKQHISIFDNGNKIYIFTQKTEAIDTSMRSKYACFNTKNIPQIAKALFVCWENKSYDMEILFPGANLISNTLDTNNFRILTQHALDNKGVPLVLKYHQNNCFEFGFESENIYPMGHGFVLDKK